jgi:hypothetical protein
MHGHRKDTIQHVEQHGLRFSTMRRTIVGGTGKVQKTPLRERYANYYG